MSLPIVFSNRTYQTGYVGVDFPPFGSSSFTVSSSTGPAITLNGRVSAVGDRVIATFAGNPAQEILYATQFDNQNGIVFGYSPDNYLRYYFSNTQLQTGTTINFSENNLGDYSPVCFASGTLIRTTRGEVAVEDLRERDVAVTASGALRPVTWIGHRHLDGHGRALPFCQQPVRIRAGAFGQGLPARDLSLSPGHPVLVGADADGTGGHLVPVMCLINGTSITREPAGSVTYWHVELDAHDILLAEGLPAESYLDWGDRPFFTQASDHALHNPDFVVPGLAARCRPVALDGPVVEAERARLSALFAASLGEACAWDDAERFGWLAG